MILPLKCDLACADGKSSGQSETNATTALCARGLSGRAVKAGSCCGRHPSGCSILPQDKPSHLSHALRENLSSSCSGSRCALSATAVSACPCRCTQNRAACRPSLPSVRPGFVRDPCPPLWFNLQGRWDKLHDCAPKQEEGGGREEGRTEEEKRAGQVDRSAAQATRVVRQSQL